MVWKYTILANTIANSRHVEETRKALTTRIEKQTS